MLQVISLRETIKPFVIKSKINTIQEKNWTILFFLTFLADSQSSSSKSSSKSLKEKTVGRKLVHSVGSTESFLSRAFTHFYCYKNFLKLVSYTFS